MTNLGLVFQWRFGKCGSISLFIFGKTDVNIELEIPDCDEVLEIQNDTKFFSQGKPGPARVMQLELPHRYRMV